MEKRRTKTKHFWSNFDRPLFPEDSQNRKKIRTSAEKLQLLGSPDISKSRIYLVSPFLSVAYFYRETGGVATQSGRIKV